MRVGPERAAAELLRALREAVSSSGGELRMLESACFGVAGTRRRETREALTGLIGRELDITAISVETDAYVAFRGAIPGGVGVIAVSGTGSVAFGMNESGEAAYADGLGPFVGDEGSGFRIGMEAVMIAARELDGRGPRTMFTAGILEALGAVDLDSLASKFQEGPPEAALAASLSQIVLEACLRGCGEAAGIVERAAGGIARSVESVAAKLGLVGRFPVVFSGGLMRKGSPLREKAGEIVRRALPEALIGQAYLTPAHGALALAISNAGVRSAAESLRLLWEGSGENDGGMDGI